MWDGPKITTRTTFSLTNSCSEGKIDKFSTSSSLCLSFIPHGCWHKLSMDAQSQFTKKSVNIAERQTRGFGWLFSACCETSHQAPIGLEMNQTLHQSQRPLALHPANHKPSYLPPSQGKSLTWSRHIYHSARYVYLCNSQQKLQNILVSTDTINFFWQFSYF